MEISLKPGKKLYFAGDFHLGIPDHTQSLKREKELVAWLRSIKHDAAAVFLMGDQFDFWFEYRYTVPAGYVRFLGTLAELADSGIEIYMFRGNHDMWTRGYWTREIGAKVIGDELAFTCAGKNFFLHHGDGLGNGEKGYKMLRRIFRAKWSSWLFARLHPNLGFSLARMWSKRSRLGQGDKYDRFLGREKEWLVGFCEAYLNKNPNINYFIFGHRHLQLDMEIQAGCRYINTGTWFKDPAYACFDGTELVLKNWK
jgi:UDP-2,3-diacylglucosamine hydrolase